MSSILRLALLSVPVVFAACTSKSESRISMVAPGALLKFREVHAAFGLDRAHVLDFPNPGFRSSRQPMTGGVACADYNGDGFLDLYVLGGDRGNYLYRNDAGKGFTDVSVASGTRLAGGAWSGCTFADIDGDGQLDLFLGGVAGTAPCILINDNGVFRDRTPGSGIDAVQTDSFCVAFGDYDGDGDLDLFLTQFRVERGAEEETQHLWRNEGGVKFTDVSAETGITAAFTDGSPYTDLTFTPNFTDIDADGDLDLLVTGDLGTNRVLRNDGGKFTVVANPAAATAHASGGAIGDYDNDLHLDWFISGVEGPGLGGNALLRNDGTGQFENTTVAAGVGSGGWGWAASFGDFDCDGFLDLVQVNGFGTDPAGPMKDYFEDPVRLFLNGRSGTFEEAAAKVALVDNKLGRGVCVFDFDRDGDLDIFIVNFFSTPSLWMNEGGNRHAWLSVALRYRPGNLRGIGARVKITANGKSQIREIRAGCNYVSQNPAEAHFGVETALQVDRIEVFWPDGTKTELKDVESRQHLTIRYE